MDHQKTPQLGKVAAVQIITMLVAVVSMLIDGIMTGIYLGEDSLAAYGLTNPVNMFLVALGVLLASGAQILGGRCVGRKDEEGLNRILTTSLTFGFLSGVIVSLFIALLIHPLCTLLGADAERLGPLTEEYLSGIILCLPALIIGQVLPGFLQMKNLRARFSLPPWPRSRPTCCWIISTSPSSTMDCGAWRWQRSSAAAFTWHCCLSLHIPQQATVFPCAPFLRLFSN